MSGISSYDLQYYNNKNVAISLSSDVLLLFYVWFDAFCIFGIFSVSRYLHFVVNSLFSERIKKQQFKFTKVGLNLLNSSKFCDSNRDSVGDF